jgi:glycosyltransferase involved in cell wall biosynthesis
VKLALVTETFPPEVNGVAMTFGVLARELALRRHEVTVYRPQRPGDRSRAGTGPYAEVSMPGMPIPGYSFLRIGFPAARALERRWRTARPDLVHVVTEGPLGASAVAAALRLGVPVTSSYHTQFHSYTRHYGFGLFRRPTLAWLRHVHNRTRRTFAPTAELCAELGQMGFERLSILSRGIDTREFRPDRRCETLRQSWGAGPADPVVLHAGRMSPEKNYTLLHTAFTAMRAVEPRLKCVLVGDGPLRERLKREFPWAVFAGFMDRSTLARHYASADLYVHPSLTETFGNVLTEAMASGLAVAGFDYAAARQYIRHGVNGFAVPRDRPGELVHAGVRLARDPQLRVRFGAAAAATAGELSWESVVAQVEEELDQCRQPSSS